MLGDVTKTLQSLSDYDAKLAKAVDDYYEAHMMMLRACDAAAQRIQRGQEVNAGKASVEAETASQLCTAMQQVAEQAMANTLVNASAAAGYLYMKRRRNQGILLDTQKTRD